MIANPAFWQAWEAGRYEDALRCSIEKPENQMSHLRRKLNGNVAVITVSAADFLYDFVMVNPVVVKGIDFARKEDLSSLYTLSQFASQIDLDSLSGDMAQLQGYVAEQMIALELQAKGHDVEFPETSNNPGWDLLVDGQPFQVKCLASATGVKKHLEIYPDIPVYVNSELAASLAAHPNVYATTISREEVLEATSSTLSHAKEVMDFEIPWIAAGISTFANTGRLIKKEIEMKDAAVNIALDTSSKALTGILGKHAGVVLGSLVFGPAGAVVGGLFGSYLTVTQSRKITGFLKRRIRTTEFESVRKSVLSLLTAVTGSIDQKISIKQRKVEQLREELIDAPANRAVYQTVYERFLDEQRYLRNKQAEIDGLKESFLRIREIEIRQLADVMGMVAKTKVHPSHYQKELITLKSAYASYTKKMI